MNEFHSTNATENQKEMNIEAVPPSADIQKDTSIDADISVHEVSSCGENQTDVTGDRAVPPSAEGPVVMGEEFRRVGSRVWWNEEAEAAVAAVNRSPFAEADASAATEASAEADASAATEASAEAERSSPSSSHRSADSGFSDRSASPGGCVANPFLGRLELSCFDTSPKNRKKQKNKEPQQQQSPASSGHDDLDLTGVEVPAGPPAHTSTPKVQCGGGRGGGSSPRLRRLCARPLSLSAGLNSRCGVAEAAVAAGAPVRRWLAELVGASEPECTTALQSKSLAADLGRQVAAAAAAATNSVRALQERTRRIAAEFNKLSRQLELDTMEHLGPLVQSLTGHVAEFARQQQSTEGADRSASAETLEHACNALREAAAEVTTAGAATADRQRLRSDARALGKAFTAVVDDTLLTHIGVLVAVLEAPASEMALRAALAALAALGLEGRRLSALVAEAGGVRALLAVVLESRCSSIRAAALRALAAVACAPDAIRCLEQAGGIEVLAELLVDEARPEPELAEAAAVLAQTTAPWVDDNPGVHGLSDHLNPIVRALTGLAERTKCSETLLLAAAALANVTYMEPRAVWPLLASGSAGRLLQAVRRLGADASVFLQEQAAALLAAMAAVPESRAPLAEQRAVVALLCFLQVRASPLQDQPEIAAAERLQHKSAIALSRLCSDPAVAEQVVELQGVPRLIRLCRDERERNHSDGVLVACLAALRKIATNCGNQIIEDFGALELVEPRLLDSFLLYSSRQESYV